MKRAGLLWLSAVAAIAAGCSKPEPTTAKASVGTAGAGKNDRKSDSRREHLDTRQDAQGTD